MCDVYIISGILGTHPIGAMVEVQEEDKYIFLYDEFSIDSVNVSSFNKMHTARLWKDYTKSEELFHECRIDFQYTQSD